MKKIKYKVSEKFLSNPNTHSSDFLIDFHKKLLKMVHSKDMELDVYEEN